MKTLNYNNVKIESILENHDFNIPGSNKNYEGYIIETENDKIYLGIDNQDLSREEFGFLVTDDDTDDYVGSRLLKIEIIETEDINPKKVNLQPNIEHTVNATFIKLYTLNGVFELVAYNAHNGYYGHEITFKSDYESYKTFL